jgi:hypothetical protein
VRLQHLGGTFIGVSVLRATNPDTATAEATVERELRKQFPRIAGHKSDRSETPP